MGAPLRARLNVTVVQLLAMKGMLADFAPPLVRSRRTEGQAIQGPRLDAHVVVERLVAPLAEVELLTTDQADHRGRGLGAGFGAGAGRVRMQQVFPMMERSLHRLRRANKP